MDEWKLDAESAASAKGDLTDPLAIKKWPKYETSVTQNPFFHIKPKRVKKLASGSSFPEGSYRFRDDPLRVVYYPDKPSRTVITLSAGTASDVSYKKRSTK